MDFTPITYQALNILWYLIPITLLLAALRSPWLKGLFGEFQINLAVKLFLPKSDYHLIKNVTLPTDNGTTQIDHIFVARYGVFVVETKNMKGWIFGSKNQKTWTQKIYKHSNRFQNPLHQNYKHIKTLEAFLDIPLAAIHSVVVFVGNSTFKTPMPENVTSASSFIRHIKSKHEQLLSETDVNNVIRNIQDRRLQPGFKTNRAHVTHVTQTILTKQPPQTTCPKCGNPMVLRVAKVGRNAGNEFWGCSTFPACKGMVSIN